jgi:hypothetical protein
MPRPLIDMFDLLTNLEKENENKIVDSTKNEYLSIEQEIECPRCHGIMTLQSEFDFLGYFCEECDFVLRLTHYPRGYDISGRAV